MLVALRAANLRVTAGNTDAVFKDVAVGQEIWIGAQSPTTIVNAGPSSAELLRFRFKTPPSTSR